MNKIRVIYRNIETFISKPSLNLIKKPSIQLFKNLSNNQDSCRTNQLNQLKKQFVKAKTKSPMIELQNMQNKLFKQSIRFGLSELVKINKSLFKTQMNINYAGDYESKFIQSHFIHSLYLNRIGANNYYFTIDDLTTTQSEFKRT